MEDMNAYFQKIETELGKWADEIKKLKDGTKNVNTGIETQYYEQVEDLMALHELARQKLQEIKEYGDAHWEDYKAGMERAMSDLSVSYNELESHFRTGQS
jgi:archaellum component FlaC